MNVQNKFHLDMDIDMEHIVVFIKVVELVKG